MDGQADLYLAGGMVADVQSGSLREAGVVVAGGRIVQILQPGERPDRAGRVIDVSGRVVVPGYIEPHTHFSLAGPSEFAGILLRHGTTTAVVDALHLMTLAKPEALPDLLESLARLPMRIRWLIRLHPQAFGDAPAFALPHLRRLWRLPSAAAVGEVTRWVDVLQGDPDLLAKIQAARSDGRRVEGHAAGASYERLAGLARAGFTSCHEAITAGEVRDRLRAGLAVMLRHSSIRPDLPELLRAVVEDPDALASVMLTLDGSMPVFIEDHGYLDHAMRIAMREGVPPMAVLRMVTVNPAAYFGWTDVGEIAPGGRADLNVLRELSDPTPEMVIAGGRVVVEDRRLVEAMPSVRLRGALREDAFPRLAPDALVQRSGDAPSLRLVNDVITEPTAGPGGLYAALVDRRGAWITRSRLEGFVDRLGGLATSFTSGLDLAVIGSSPPDMAQALARLGELRGGVVVIEDGREVFSLAFDDVACSSRPWGDVVEANRRFNALMRERGYRFGDPLFSLLFLTFDSLPWIRLTSRGIWDVRRREVVSPSSLL